MKLVKQMPIQYDIERIHKEWNDIRTKLNPNDWFNETQVSIHHSGDINYIDGCGWKYEGEENFIHINPLFKGTIFEEIIKDHDGYRARILLIKPLALYTMHQDWDKRMHLAIETNDSSFFIFPKDDQVHHIPVDGHLYETDTSKFHTYINAHPKKERIHMVFNV